MLTPSALHRPRYHLEVFDSPIARIAPHFRESFAALDTASWHHWRNHLLESAFPAMSLAHGSLRRGNREGMSSQISECIVLRTYPYKESDLIVSFFTRDQGKLRGIARRARRPSSKFGAGLERLAHGKMQFFLPENRDLATLDGCEVIGDALTLSADYDRSVAGDFLAEAAEQLLPMAEPNERFFRLLLAVTDFLAGAETPAAVWPAVTYFCLWAVKLEGFLPPMALSEEDRAIAEEMLAHSVKDLTPAAWSHEWAAELRHSLIGIIEEHTERRLVTVKYLEGLGAAAKS